MYRNISIAALCGGILVGSVIGGSYMIATAIRQSGDRQVNAIQQAGYEQSLATDRAAERAEQAAQPPSPAEQAAARAAERYEQLKRDTDQFKMSIYGGYGR